MRGPRSGSRPSLVSSIDNSSSSSETVNVVSSGQPQPDVMNFLVDLCPEDVLPKILAFAGPQKTATLSKVNRVWRDVIAEDRTWRVLCEDLYKVCSYLRCLFQYSKNWNSIQKTRISRNQGLQGLTERTRAVPVLLTTFSLCNFSLSDSGHQSRRHLYPGKTFTGKILLFQQTIHRFTQLLTNCPTAPRKSSVKMRKSAF
jgi:hypothetical protein